MDLEYQLNALTDKCIALEKNLIEEKRMHTDNYHNEILKQELSKYKLENKNLQAVIQALQTDKNILEDENSQLKLKSRGCLHCYPPLEHNEASWQLPKNKSRATAPNSLYTPEHSNRFRILPIENHDKDDKEENISKENNLVRVKTSNYKNSFAPATTEKSPGSKKPSKQSHLIVMADSHGKQLGNLIQQKTHVNVCSFVRPGARFNQVTQDVKELTRDLKKEDHLLVMAGTNNVENSSVKSLINDIRRLISNSDHTNLLLATIPMRHDCPELELKISRLNSEIEKLATNYSNLKLVSLHLLPRHNFTTHGLHMNRSGKRRVSEMVCRLLHQKTTQQGTPTTKKAFKPPKDGITVVEAEMCDIFQYYEDDSTAALAHAISADFSSERHMSAGVAVSFRRRFGRPLISDLVNKKLALQQIHNGPWVYSLITKDVFNGKPSKEDYDEAFVQLQHDFKIKGLKTLVCSAMGCVRDLIQPEHFARNITNFHRATGATVCVISYDQQAQRKLWNSLTHDEFVKILRESIAARLQEADVPNIQEAVLVGDVGTLTTPRTCDKPSLQAPVLTPHTSNCTTSQQNYSTPTLSCFPSPTTPPTFNTSLISSPILTSPVPNQKNIALNKIVNPS